MTPDQLTALHRWLNAESGRTLAHIWADIERARRIGCKYDDLPMDRVSFQAGLEALAAAGLAERVGERWLWLPVVRQSVCEPKERMLFA